MTSYTYIDNIATQNITFAIAGSSISSNKKIPGNLSDYTVIIVSKELTDQSHISEAADTILTRGCKNIAFCGESSQEWRPIFDAKDASLNGFNDITGYDDFAVMWGIESIDDLPHEVSTSWNQALILCDNMSTVKACQEVLKEEQPIFG
ncbi:hypothetical protein [Butyrivibrio proteoclasticus]|uniref:hypothetical protein n=1 Tax=Butyrivibrio proteoclasticus TaxID=43305 RepID=UPI00047E434C|nr:hypothetical protein [Butyrivibrio proteoclasticus]